MTQRGFEAFIAEHGSQMLLLPHATMRAATGRACPGVKIYLPAPAGDWGMVFEGRLDDDGRPFMRCLAFGRRHPLRAGQPSVYQIAARRLESP